MKIIPISEGSFTIDKTKQFVPFNEEQHELQDRPVGSLLVEIQPFVVITSKDILLLDTGLGFAGTNGELQLHNNLREAGVDPSTITKVLLSHLHKDHSGGVCMSSKTELSFPKATYYVQKKEYDHAMLNKSASYITKDFELLGKASNVVFLEGNGTLDDYIRYEITGAHSLYHQVFWINEGSEQIFFGADDAPQLYQMKHRFVAKYDHDGRKAAKLRQEWFDKGQQEGWNFLFYHDIKTPVYKARHTSHT